MMAIEGFHPFMCVVIGDEDDKIITCNDSKLFRFEALVGDLRPVYRLLWTNNHTDCHFETLVDELVAKKVMLELKVGSVPIGQNQYEP
mmetsp:Transcript_1820/g.2279  ORF Transcript_1820/g.2279 Transcript_1820/m.2279 type:complete len:88 (+) Transcript_1820:508-771(+)|eukprot:CAMPEP_0168323392 /NCGR_PEP_ID=MMETSP0213-20121227/3453_1 /TAXON_ID=151035 /ORGANISM="Euplotes harpa, Strain FSP1.4" /LENGTH=87 /DNA_ID=CAMNT_0008325453 /DNA_START=749 /DNA_END=1012 /DNA_ORIENTATION=-